MNINTFNPPYLDILPDQALRLPLSTVLRDLDKLFGHNLYMAFDPATDMALADVQTDTAWIKTAKTVGINVRSIGTFWHIIPYVMTLPRSWNAIHILPIWEPGVVASLYGPSSWNINPEFFNGELAQAFLHLDTVEKQLKVVINLLHLMGKAVGMDVVPHTDRFSEAAMANPAFFEWLQRRDMQLLRHSGNLHQTVEQILFEHLQERGSADPELPLPDSAEKLFRQTPEPQRLLMMFGVVHDYWGRLGRRKAMVQLLYEAGLETVPATMGPPYRGIEVDPDPQALVRDEDGREWRDYRITRPEPFSRVFGPLARYRLYADKNTDWALDFEQPNTAAWAYVCEHYADIQRRYNFDFMRGDMSHVQMRPDGVPEQPGPYYDLLAAVKTHILKEKTGFEYFAESFLAPPGEMAYGDECEHLEAALADSTLGDLQSEPIHTVRFMRQFAQYRHWLDTRKFAPCFTVMTADKDDPRFDGFYLAGNEVRYFLSLFLWDMPAYVGLGFECRDPHPVPAPNEHYTKLYVFQVPEGPKATRGPYQWGKNQTLYANLCRQKALADALLPALSAKKLQWLLPPDPEGERKVIAWTDGAQHIFVANLADCAVETPIDLQVPLSEPLTLQFSTSTVSNTVLVLQDKQLLVLGLGPLEGVFLSQR